jgi:hypothetical protein
MKMAETGVCLKVIAGADGKGLPAETPRRKESKNRLDPKHSFPLHLCGFAALRENHVFQPVRVNNMLQRVPDPRD